MKALLVGIAAVIVALAVSTLGGTSAQNGDWVVKRLRTPVFVNRGDAWVQLHQGEVVGPGQPLQTSKFGRVTLMRGKQRLDIGPNTLIMITERGGAGAYTVVNEKFGQVTADVDHRDVAHFAVETPYLAAVVKGTHFTVNANDTGGSVSVERGRVQVTDTVHQLTVGVSANQTAEVNDGTAPGLTVSGIGELETVVGTATGKPVPGVGANGKGQGLAKGATSSQGTSAVAHAVKGYGDANRNANVALSGQ